MKLRSMKSVKSIGPGIQKDISDKAADEPVQNKDYYLIESKLLNGETIILCKVKSALPYVKKEFPGTVIYFPPEIYELCRLKDDHDAIKKIHLVKKKFGGWIVPTNNSKGGSQ